MTRFALLLWKDAVTEARTLERISTLAVFAAAVMATLHFSVPASPDTRRTVAAGFLWSVIVFASILEARRSFEAERRDGTLDALRSAPVDPAVIYGAKALSSVIVLSVLACVLVPLTAVLFASGTARIAPALGICVLGIVGLVAWGTLLAVVAGGTRAADVVLPVLLFPLIVPQTIGTVRLLAAALTGVELGDAATGFLLVGAFDVLALGTSLVLFDYVLDE